MSEIVAFEHLSLDGVMRAPAEKYEDNRGGFKHGSWAAGDSDPVIDEYLLLIHPVILGSALRLFADRAELAQLQLADSTPTTTGVIIATYQSSAK